MPLKPRIQNYILLRSNQMDTQICFKQDFPLLGIIWTTNTQACILEAFIAPSSTLVGWEGYAPFPVTPTSCVPLLPQNLDPLTTDTLNPF